MSDEQRVMAIKSLERRTQEQLSALAQAVEASRGINEMMNVQLDRQAAKIDRLEAINADLLVALMEITKGEGAFSLDQLTFANNTIESMKTIANAAIAKARGEE